MLQHLLVPLDGSPLAETVLPACAWLARTLGANVTLLHVIERAAPAAVHGVRHLTEPGEADAYLDVTARALGSGFRITRHVHVPGEKDVAQSIVDHATEQDADLIVLSTHGRGGLRHRLFGSIAQRVAAKGTVPVLLLTPGGAQGPASLAGRMVLVPLDGQSAHEQGIPMAAELARHFGAALHLLVVVPTLGTLTPEQAATGQLLPGATAALLELDQLHAGAYVEGHVARLAADGFEVTGEIARGSPTEVILETAARVSADIIVLGTHGRVGMDAFWTGSIAPRVARRADFPLLLVPVSDRQ